MRRRAAQPASRGAGRTCSRPSMHPRASRTDATDITRLRRHPAIMRVLLGGIGVSAEGKPEFRLARRLRHSSSAAGEATPARCAASRSRSRARCSDWRTLSVSGRAPAPRRDGSARIVASRRRRATSAAKQRAAFPRSSEPASASPRTTCPTTAHPDRARPGRACASSAKRRRARAAPPAASGASAHESDRPRRDRGVRGRGSRASRSEWQGLEARVRVSGRPPPPR